MWFVGYEVIINVPNGVTGSEADPLRDGPVLLLSFRKLLLGTERLVALLFPSSVLCCDIVDSGGDIRAWLQLVVVAVLCWWLSFGDE